MKRLAGIEGWAEGTKESDGKEVAFIQQIGMTINQNTTSGWDNTNVPRNQGDNNPYSAWDQASKNQTSSNQGPYSQGYQQQPFQPQFQQPNFQKQPSQQHSLWDVLSQNPALSYQINSIFQKPIREYKFPSPFIKYKIIPMLDDKKCLDVTTVNNDSKKLKKNNLIIWDYHGGPNQQFYIKESDKAIKKYYIINVSKGFTVEVPDSSSKNGEKMLVNPRNDSANELWELNQSSHDSF